MSQSDPLAALRSRFLMRCRKDLKVLEAALADPSLRTGEALRTTAHKLAGVAAMFGYIEVSKAASPIDDGLHDGLAPSAADIEALIGLMKAIV